MKLVRKLNWLACIAMTISTVGLNSAAAVAQSDCGCSQTPVQGYHLSQPGQSSCDSGYGTSGTLFSRMRNALRCDSKYRPGLWDGYCDERVACDQSSHSGIGQFGGGHFGGGRFGGGRLLGGCNQGCENVTPNECGTANASACGGCNLFGGGLFGGKSQCGSCGWRQQGSRHTSRRLFSFPQAAGCGSGAYGLPNEGDCGCGAAVEPTCAAAASDCDNVCGNAGGCGSIFGIKHSCFRNDGHFFGCFSRHGHRWGSMFSGANEGGGGLFGKHQRGHSFGSLGCGHCQNAVPVASATCGTDQVSVGQGTWAPAPVSAE